MPRDCTELPFALYELNILFSARLLVDEQSRSVFYAVSNTMKHTKQKGKRNSQNRKIPGQSAQAPRALISGMGTGAIQTPMRAKERKYILASAQGGSALGAYNSGAVYAANPSILLVNNMARGTTVQTRIGDQALFKRLFLQGTINASNQITANYSTLRMVVLVDLEANGTLVTLADVFGTSNPLVNAVFNFNNRNFDRKFRVLHDEWWTLGGNCGGGQFPQRNVKIDLRLNVPTGYQRGNAGSIADIDTGAIYLIWISDASATGTQLYMTAEGFTEFTDE